MAGRRAFSSLRNGNIRAVSEGEGVRSANGRAAAHERGRVAVMAETDGVAELARDHDAGDVRSVSGNARALRIPTSALSWFGQRAAKETKAASGRATTMSPGQRVSEAGNGGPSQVVTAALISANSPTGMAPVCVLAGPSRNGEPISEEV
jgi:hypothetical protein